MTENNLKNRVNRLETRFSVIETKIDMFIDEMRDRDNRRNYSICYRLFDILPIGGFCD